MSARPVFGRPVVYSADLDCPHAVRLLGFLADRLGRLHAADFCLVCGGRTENIARRDLQAAGILAILPVLRDTREEGA